MALAKAISRLGSLAVVMVAVSACSDPLDMSKVIDVIPSPDGKRAVVVLLYTHANSSAKTTQVDLKTPPFPKPGERYAPKNPILVALTTGEPTQTTVETRWLSDTKLDLCVQPASRLILFHASGRGDNFVGEFPHELPVSFCAALSDPTQK